MLGTSEERASTQDPHAATDAAEVMHACLSPASFWPPERQGSLSAWLEHAPFAFWLVEALQPRTLVELGTHGGYSYFAFCQAVRRLELETRCYAVDTWKGDEHAGFYGEEVYQAFRDYHDPRYSSFSRLMRSTFDEAVRHFSDGAIDLLHIDGRHLYDDVKNDFENWRPKLSDHGVVLFHDTGVQRDNFGVFKLWEELSAEHPHFEFHHGFGLGVLGVGRNPPAPVRALFAATGDDQASAQIREAYGRLGATVSAQFHAQRLSSELEAQTAEADALRDELEAQPGDLKALRRELAVIKASTSWRATEPFRWIVRALRRGG